MVDQASVNGRGTASVPDSRSAEYEGVAEFVDDLASLAELQARLAVVDFREASRKAAIPLVLTVAGLAVTMVSVPVALFAVSWLLAMTLGIHQGWALLLVAAAAMVLGGVVAVLGGIRLQNSFDSFRRSRKQLMLNLAWVRTVLVTSASARTHPRRRL